MLSGVFSQLPEPDSGAAYFGEQPDFAAGNPLHATILSDDALPQPHPLTPEERLQRCVYLRQKDAIQTVRIAGRTILKQLQ